MLSIAEIVQSSLNRFQHFVFNDHMMLTVANSVHSTFTLIVQGNIVTNTKYNSVLESTHSCFKFETVKLCIQQKCHYQVISFVLSELSVLFSINVVTFFQLKSLDL